MHIFTSLNKWLNELDKMIYWDIDRTRFPLSFMTTSVLFTGTVKLLNSAFNISKTTTIHKEILTSKNLMNLTNRFNSSNLNLSNFYWLSASMNKSIARCRYSSRNMPYNCIVFIYLFNDFRSERVMWISKNSFVHMHMVSLNCED